GPGSAAPVTVPEPRQVMSAGPAVLVVDDNPANLQLLQSQLKTLGLAAEICADAEPALQLWRQARHPLVLVDCAMPGMDGFDFTRTLRNEEAALSPALRSTVVAITGSPEEYEAR